MDSIGTDASTLDVVVVEDDLELREAIELLFEVDERFRVIRDPGLTRSNVVVVDVDGADGGPTVCRWLRARLPDARIVALSSFPDPFTLVEVLRAGADAYIDTATAWIDVVPTIAELCGLGRAASTSIA